MREKFVESIIGRFQTWIGIYLNEVRSELLVKHKIIAEKFKRIKSLFGVDQVEGCSDRVGYDFFYLHYNVSLYVYFFLRVGRGKIFLKLPVGKLIASFVFTIIFAVFLDGIVHKVHIFICKIVHTKFFGTCSYVAIAIEVSFHETIVGGDERKTPNIKFSTIIEQGVMNILLENTCVLVVKTV